MGATPGDEPVVGEHDGTRTGKVGDPLGELEPGPQVRHDGHVLAEGVVHRSRRVRRVRKRADRVGVHVVDVSRRQERVEQRLDRGPGGVGVDQATGEMSNHLLVGHRGPLPQRQHVVEPQPGEVARLRSRKVGATALDPDDAPLAAEVIGLDELGRGVAAPMEDE